MEFNENRDVWVFCEIQDHEKVYEGALELLSKGRNLVQKTGGKLYAIIMALDAESYIEDIKKIGPDIILYYSNNHLKHYDSQIIPDLFSSLIDEYKPNIILFSSTEAGKDLAPRLSFRFSTGLTSHCSDLDIIDLPEYGENLLLMKRPAFSGNLITTIICPKTRPQLATVQPGIFEKKEIPCNTEVIELDFNYNISSLKIKTLKAPIRWNREHLPLEQADIIVAGGRGVSNKKNFKNLHKLAELINAEVGATRVPVSNNWCEKERMIGQTGKKIKPKLYMGFGISGQIQHTSSIVDSDIIVSINNDPEAPIKELSDFIIEEDAGQFISKLIERLKIENS